MHNALLARSDREPGHSATNEPANTLLALCKEAFALHSAGRFAEAITRYRQILSLKPDLPEIYLFLGHALAALGKPEAAVVAFQCSVALKPNNPEALSNCGLALTNLGLFSEAETKYRQAIGVSPGFAPAYNDLGLMLRETGRLTEARQALEQAVKLAPKMTSYYDNLAAVRPFNAGDPYLTALEALEEDSEALPAADRIPLHFALAKAYENIDQPESAFQQLLKGNRLKREQIVYDEAATLGIMDRLRALTSRDFIQARQGYGESSMLPIFIVGMTRSGTTLIEQILASHPQVFGAGELLLLDQAAGSIRKALQGSPPFPDMMLNMSAEHFRTLGALYLNRIAQRAPGATRITDKMTGNFLLAGLIHLALPNAKIIHAVRDAADTCVSCFAQNFTQGQEHTYDLTELGRYYRRYQSLMAHWHEVLPRGRIMDVHYEDLVADLESVARRVVAHCGLTWDDRCLDFHRTERPIRTASATQVRKPIYKDSVGRSRKYQALLGPLLVELSQATKQDA
jgi:Flp pilus assembly protein TadD